MARHSSSYPCKVYQVFSHALEAEAQLEREKNHNSGSDVHHEASFRSALVALQAQQKI